MKQRSLVLVDFPFSDLSEVKVRPSLVVSNDAYNNQRNDVLVCAVTSNPKQYEYSVGIKSSDMEDGRLLLPSQVKADKLMLLDKTQILKVLGKISKEKFWEVAGQIQILVSEKPEEK